RMDPQASAMKLLWPQRGLALRFLYLGYGLASVFLVAAATETYRVGQALLNDAALTPAFLASEQRNIARLRNVLTTGINLSKDFVMSGGRAGVIPPARLIKFRADAEEALSETQGSWFLAPHAKLIDDRMKEFLSAFDALLLWDSPHVLRGG